MLQKFLQPQKAFVLIAVALCSLAVLNVVTFPTRGTSVGTTQAPVLTRQPSPKTAQPLQPEATLEQPVPLAEKPLLDLPGPGQQTAEPSLPQPSDLGSTVPEKPSVPSPQASAPAPLPPASPRYLEKKSPAQLYANNADSYVSQLLKKFGL